MIRPKVQLKGNFHNTEKLKKAVQKAHDCYFTLGVHDDAGDYPPTKEQPNPPKASDVAWWLEFGTKRMPARPFLNPTLSTNLERIRKKMALGLVGIAFHDWTVEKGLTAVADYVLMLVQNKVKSNVGPALSGEWDPPKGYLGWKKEHGMGQRTLIATGLLYRSLTYKLFLSKGQELAAAKSEGKAPGAHEDIQDFAAARAQARKDGMAAKAKAREERQAQAGRDIFGKFLSKKAEAGKAKVGKSHQAAKAPRGRFRRK